MASASPGGTRMPQRRRRGGQLAAFGLGDQRSAAGEDPAELGGQGEGLGLGALRQKMNVGGVRAARSGAGLGLQRQQGDVGAAGEPPLEPWPRRARAAQHQLDFADAHAAARRPRPAPPGPASRPCCRRTARPPDVRRRPTGGAACSAPAAAGSRRCRPSSGTGTGAPRRPRSARSRAAHAHADGRDQIEAAHQPAIGAAQQAPQPRPLAPGRGAHAASDFQVLDVQARPRATQPGGEQRGGRGAARSARPPRPDRGESAPPATGRAARLLSANDSRCTIRAGGVGARGSQMRAAQHPHTAHGLAPPCPGGVAGGHPPFRIVGRRGDHAHLVAALAEPCGEISGIPPDAREFRSEVETEDEDSSSISTLRRTRAR